MLIGNDGLTDAEVRERVERGDVNRVTTPTNRSVLDIVRANVLTRFNALLGSLFVVVLLVGPWQDALFGGILVVNALIGIVQELRAKWTLDQLALVSQTKARTLRAGQAIDIPAADIVLDDFIELASGDQVLVDGILLNVAGLDIDESLLTGESEPVAKHPGEEVLSGSFVVAGTGRYRATRVGASAYAHRLASEAKRFSLAHSELRTGINRILRYITWALVPTAGLLFASQFAVHTSVADALLFSAAGVVAMVPEGLVLLTSLALALGAVRLARHQTLVQDLAATETLARVDVICLDKTGTLTEPDPQVERIDSLGNYPDVERVLAALAAIEPDPNATLRAIGRAYPQNQGHATAGVVPFSSARKWSGATLDGLGTWVLGAPEMLLSAIPDSEFVRQSAQTHANTGRRVLLLAQTGGELVSERLPPDLVPVAFILLIEQIRGDAAETLRYFSDQGIVIKVISGDHPGTVNQVATQVGIANGMAPVDARTLPENAEALANLVETRSVFGRISPQQKQSVIAALQAKGHVVAMVGDGVNDVLALKRADIGIAMGAGTGAARAVSQLVLLDNQFSNLPAVIAEGRRIIGNVERLAVLFLTKTVYAMLLAVTVGIADITFPFLPRHLTLVGALTIGIPAFFLSLEQNAERARTGFVGRVLRFAAPAGLIIAAATFATYAMAHTYLGSNLEIARSAATVALFAVATAVLVIVAQPLKPMRLVLVGSMVAAFVIVLGLPWLQTFFALGALPRNVWLAVSGSVTVSTALLHWSSLAAIHSPSEAIKSRPLRAKAVVEWLLGVESPKWFLMVSAVFVVGGSWLFFGVLEDVISHDPLVDVDVFVYHLLQALRTPAMDRVMVTITELGDVQVLLPVILVALMWFIAQRAWLAAGYWLAAIVVAEVLAKVLKLTLHRQRPGAMYDGIEQFSFPSGHATMSVVVYGFLAFLLCREIRPSLRRFVISLATILVVSIASSRLYLGAHWLSDVLGGISFGVAWVAALAIAYEYQSHEQFRPEKFAAIMAATVMVAGIAHIGSSLGLDLLRYAPPIFAPG